MTVVLGVDGGGTRTRLVAADGDGQVRGFLETGSINLDDHGRERATEVLRAGVARLRRAAGLADGPFDAAFLALGGLLSNDDRNAAQEMAAAARVAPPGRIGVHHDAFGALAGGLLGAEGMILVTGTGSICFGRTSDGREAKCGNWGPRIGDEGSGYWLGREALRAAARAHDGRGRATSLSDDVGTFLGITDMDELLGRIHAEGFGRATVARLATSVLRLAAAGDSVAADILERGCRELAHCVAVVHERLFAAPGVPLLSTGGLTRDPGYVAVLRRAVERRVPAARFVAPILPPVLGAVRLALALAERPPTHDVDARLARAREGLPPSF